MRPVARRRRSGLKTTQIPDQSTSRNGQDAITKPKCSGTRESFTEPLAVDIFRESMADFVEEYSRPGVRLVLRAAAGLGDEVEITNGTLRDPAGILVLVNGAWSILVRHRFHNRHVDCDLRAIDRSDLPVELQGVVPSEPHLALCIGQLGGARWAVSSALRHRVHPDPADPPADGPPRVPMNLLTIMGAIGTTRVSHGGDL